MKKQALTAVMLLSASALHAQSIGPSTLNAAGGWMAVSGDTFEWSIGEMAVVGTFSSAGLIVTQGVLQPVIKPVGIHQTFLTDHLRVFPNPAENVLFLQPAFSSGGKLECLLQDVTGKLIRKTEWKLETGKEKQQLDLHTIAAGSYLLQVSFTQGDQKYLTPYKIQKIH